MVGIPDAGSSPGGFRTQCDFPPGEFLGGRDQILRRFTLIVTKGYCNRVCLGAGKGGEGQQSEGWGEEARKRIERLPIGGGRYSASGDLPCPASAGAHFAGKRRRTRVSLLQYPHEHLELLPATLIALKQLVACDIAQQTSARR